MNRGHFVVHTDHGNIVVKKNDKGMPYINLAGVDGEIALDCVQTVGETWKVSLVARWRKPVRRGRRRVWWGIQPTVIFLGWYVQITS